MRLRDGISLLVVLLAADACATPGSVRVLNTPSPDARPAAHVVSISDYGGAVASIRAVLQRDYDVPAYPVSFHFYADRREFERGLLDVGYTQEFARSTAKTMDAIGGYRRVLLNEAALNRQKWPSRVASLAHELVHSLQYEMGGGRRGTSDQWLREGFAEWIALQVLHRLHGTSFLDARYRYRAAVRTAGRSRCPALADMVTFSQWVELNASRETPAYPLAFLAVDLLVERHGVEAVFKYFRLFASRQDRAENFRTAFGEDLEAFERALLAHLW